MEENATFYYKNKLIKLTDAEYFARQELNYSSFKNFLISGKYFEAKLAEEEKEASDSLLFGSIFHASILDKDELDKYMPFDPVDKRTKAGKEEWEKLQNEATENNKTLVPRDIYESALNVSLTPIAQSILDQSDNICEHSVIWDFGDIACKSKIDIFNPTTGVLTDVKTTRDLANFERAINSNRYYLQLAFYDLALKACGYEVAQWKILAVENTAPYDSTVFTLAPEYMDFAKSLIEVQLKRFAFQRDFAGFKGLSEESEIVCALPNYVY